MCEASHLGDKKMKIILSVIVVMLMIGAQMRYAKFEYDLGFKREVSDATQYQIKKLRRS